MPEFSRFAAMDTTAAGREETAIRAVNRFCRGGQMAQQLHHGGEPLGGVHFDAPLDDGPERAICQILCRMAAGTEYIHHNADAEHVGSHIAVAKAELFRGGIAHSTQKLGVLLLLGICLGRGVQIQKDNSAAGGQKNILRFHIPMNGRGGSVPAVLTGGCHRRILLPPQSADLP